MSWVMLRSGLSGSGYRRSRCPASSGGTAVEGKAASAVSAPFTAGACATRRSTAVERRCRASVFGGRASTNTAHAR